ncbi:MAG: 6-phosphogluconolactonase [Burkholderiaceae bacterium]|nr:6-phosphogluconolactonase [Burkholderiaceae bacterium]
MPSGPRWHPVADALALEDEAVARISDAARQALALQDFFRIVLAGGNTPRNVYRKLVGLRTDWSRWQVYFGDERCLPVNDEQRNDRMASATLLDQAPIPAGAVHRIPAERGAADAARAYERTLADVGVFDLVLLGLGEDGHTASLFPGHERGDAPGSPDVLAVFDAPKPPPERVSMSAARLSRARGVLFLVAGESKCDAVRRWFVGEDIPAASVQAPGGVNVLVEEALLPST